MVDIEPSIWSGSGLAPKHDPSVPSHCHERADRGDDPRAAIRSLRTVLDALPVAVSLTDETGRVLLRNEAAADALARDRTVPPDDRVTREALETGRSCGNVVTKHVDDAGRAWWKQTDRYAVTADDAKAHWLTVTSDVTRFKAIEEELRGANESLDQFATLVSHDLLTPLSRVSSWMSVLKHAMADNASPDAHASLEEIDAGLGRMRKMVERLLAFSRDTAQALRLETVVLADVLHFLRPWDADDVTLIDATNGMAVVGDTVLLSHVFKNLIGNTRRHAAQSTVTVRARADAEWCIIEVEDDGPGIAAAESERIFSPFYRIGKPGRGVEGHGMGLRFCRRIARAHGGDIRHDAAFVGGARFVLRLRPA